MNSVKYRKVDVDGQAMAYREAGPADGRVLLLLHGFPTSSHMFRDLIPMLADQYRVIAPDLPGFGQSDLPAKLSFEGMATAATRFTEVLGLSRFAIYIFDYGAPVGLRMALAHPQRISAIISQNGNAYAEGLSGAWAPVQAYWKNPVQDRREALRVL